MASSVRALPVEHTMSWRYLGTRHCLHGVATTVASAPPAVVLAVARPASPSAAQPAVWHVPRLQHPAATAAATSVAKSTLCGQLGVSSLEAVLALRT